MKLNTLQSHTFNIGSTLKRGKIIPIFLPFAGCPFKCLYCAQDSQTGQGDVSVLHALKAFEDDLKSNMERFASSPSIEIAFYGGTFTALSSTDFEACLNTFISAKKQLSNMGLYVYGRCSTRPDCLENTARLTQMKEAGIDLIELGIQSFDDDVLMGLGRGYTSDVAKKACARVQELGFLLGIQLMPGSPKKTETKPFDFFSFFGENNSPQPPLLANFCKQSLQKFAKLGFPKGIIPFGGEFERQSLSNRNNVQWTWEAEPPKLQKTNTQDKETFYADVRCALSFTPACLRYYPCLVLENTALANLWQRGDFSPWDLEECVNALGYALFLAWQKEVPVIRLSVAFEESFETHILAGVRHPALGSLIKARALRYAFVYAQDNYGEIVHCEELGTSQAKISTQKATLTMDKNKIKNLYLPKNVQGYIFGEKNALKAEWEQDICLKNIFYKSKSSLFCCIRSDDIL